MRAGLDTNILVYAEGANDAARQSAALALCAALDSSRAFIPVQALGELYNVLTRRLRWDRPRAANTIASWRGSFQSAPTSDATLRAAVELASAHGLVIWDAVILASCAEARCEVLLSEDMQDGFAWRGVTIVNPFAASPHKLLAALL